MSNLIKLSKHHENQTPNAGRHARRDAVRRAAVHVRHAGHAVNKKPRNHAGLKTKLMQITIEELAALTRPRYAAETGNASTVAPFEIGKNYFIRTVTHHHTGRLVAVYLTELVLEDAAWIADDGRLADALKTETFNEVEPFPAGKQVIIGRGSIIDAIQINRIPTSQK